MPFTDQDKAELTGIVGEVLKAALAEHRTEISKEISGANARTAKELKDKLAGALSKEELDRVLQERDAAAQQNKDKGGQDDKTKGGNGAQPDGKQQDPEVLKLRGELDAIKTERASEREAFRKKEEEAARKEEDAALDRALGTHVKPEFVLPVRLMLREGKVLSRGQDGSILFKVQKKYGTVVTPEDVPLEDGVKEWAGTDAAKPFLPPKDSKGSGDTRGGRGGGGGAAGGHEDYKAGVLSALRGSAG